MSSTNLNAARSVIHRIYLLLALVVVGVVLVYYAVPPELVGRNRSDKRFIWHHQRLHDAIDDLSRLALISHLHAVRDRPAHAGTPDDIIGRMAIGTRAEMTRLHATSVTLAREPYLPGAAPLVVRLNRLLAAFLDRPDSPAALEDLLLVTEQLRQLSVRAVELREEAGGLSLLHHDHWLTGVVSVLLAGIGWAGLHIIKSSRVTLRVLANTIAQRDAQARALERERDFAARLVETAPTIILLLDPQGRIEHVNPYFVQLTGWPLAEIKGRDWFETMLPERERERVREHFRQVVQAGSSPSRPARVHLNPILTRAGEERGIEWRNQVLCDPNGQTTGVLAVGVDVTDRARAEESIRRSLHEKEILLREIHHRVKNNLQIVSSLLHFQGKKVQGTPAVIVFREARERLHSMILVHEKLYNSRNLSEIDFGDYLQTLVRQMAHSSAEANGSIRFSVDAASLSLPIEIVLPCGMIMVELMTNVAKYAFPGGGTGEASVRLEATSDRVTLTVEDKGVGLPVDFDPATTLTFGWHLIRNLTQQIDGAIGIERQTGTRVTLSFPRPQAA